MTATATPGTVSEIAAALGREPEVVRTSVVRPNLRYDVEEAANEEERLRILVQRLHEIAGAPAILYARSRRSTETLARVLSGYGFRARPYHAGLEPDERSSVQDAFVGGSLQVVTATTAFGMGIDKPDVRLVALVNHPDSLESYVQMIGRAGRDGAPSGTLLLAGAGDAASLRRFALGDVPRTDDLRAVYRALRDSGGRVDPEALLPVAGDHDPRVLVGMLEQAGLVRRGYDEGRALTVDVTSAPSDAGARVDELLRRYRQVAESRVERMIAFGESDRCRHAQVAEHFGEAIDEPCGACDVCAPRTGRRPAVAAAAALPDDIAGTIVRAVEGLAWPLGRKSLAATLRGSVSAPPSARRSASYGVLAAAGDGEVTRWIRALESAGALVETVTPDGFRVLRPIPDAKLPSLGPLARASGDPDLVARLRAWRLERSRADGVPAFVVFNDRTLEELAAARPSTSEELVGVRGFGPGKVDRYGDALLELVATA
jgi:ATP-dependent DNA helicase RecQ